MNEARIPLFKSLSHSNLFYLSFIDSNIKQTTMNTILKLIPVSLVVTAFCNAMKFFVEDKELINDIMLQLNIGMSHSFEDKPKLLFLKGKGEDVCIKLNDLAWIQAEGCYVRFHYANGKSKIMSGNLHAVMLQLYAGGVDYIVRIHNSHAVNLYHITGRSGNVIFVGNASLSVSSKYKYFFSKHCIAISKTA